MRRCDVWMENEVDAALVVRIKKPKWWVRGAPGQYAKLDAKYVCAWVRRSLMRMCPSESFLPAAPGAFAVQFKPLAKVVRRPVCAWKVPNRRGNVVLPGPERKLGKVLLEKPLVRR